jgi:hypothetical protein
MLTLAPLLKIPWTPLRLQQSRKTPFGQSSIDFAIALVLLTLPIVG